MENENYKSTPRTDAAAYDSQPGNPMCPNGSFVVKADFARTLERELRELEFMAAQLATAKQQLRKSERKEDELMDGLANATAKQLKAEADLATATTALADARARVKELEELLRECAPALDDNYVLGWAPTLPERIRAADRSAMATKEGAV